ncbi:MAG: hypothetical protein Q8L13_11630 [Bradyrhizobium sp.]|uniref:phage major tropism determinant n=1 Tax=Bradyrhizobium sp. TaxID=376 RepID=UPI0027303ADD|nr:hypothetical protein [Bradyrhizobium sp.]MDP1866975.1 hypothetical protein [Bradyrhizobium sp.]
MSVAKQVRTESGAPLLVKTDPNSPVLKVAGRDSLVIRAGTYFAVYSFAEDKPVQMPVDGLEAGADYAISVVDGVAAAFRADAPPVASDYIGGFHFAPGGNAVARSGGDDIPAINPCSLWDLNFRPACPDPRGMTLVEMPGRKFWTDIYLAGSNCSIDGTSRFGATIADGDDCPADAKGKRYKKFDYATAAAVMAAHGKGLLSVEEFFAAAIGVTEKTAHAGNPKVTGLDTPRTSRFGLMQATGNMWVWGHDGDPDEPRASMFGGSWLHVGDAGSRYASVAFSWPEYSVDNLGARGRSDHLQLD